jgi:hypothetical protein
MNNMPRRLPIVTLNGVDYFLDERLRQLRNTENPSDYINLPRGGDFDEEQLRGIEEEARALRAQV